MGLFNNPRPEVLALILTLALVSLTAFAQDKNYNAELAAPKSECSAVLFDKTELLTALGDPRPSENGPPLTWRFAAPVDPEVLSCVEGKTFTAIFKFSGRDGAAVTGLVARPRTLLTNQQTWYTAQQEDGSQWVYAALRLPKSRAMRLELPQIVIDAECDNCNATDTWLTYDFQTSESSIRSGELFASFQKRTLRKELPPILTNNQPSSANATVGSYWEFRTTAQNMCGTLFDGAISFTVTGQYGDEKFSWWLSSNNQLYEAEVGVEETHRIVRWSPKYAWDLCADPKAEIVLRLECRDCRVSQPQVVRPMRAEAPNGASSATIASLSAHWTHNGGICELETVGGELAAVVPGDIPRLWFHEAAITRGSVTNYVKEIHLHQWAAERKFVSEWQAALTKDPTNLQQTNGHGFRFSCLGIRGEFYRLVNYGQQNRAIDTFNNWIFNESYQEDGEAPGNVEKEFGSSITPSGQSHIAGRMAPKWQCRVYINGTMQPLIALSHKSTFGRPPTWRFFTPLQREVFACVQGTKFTAVFKFSGKDRTPIKNFNARPRSLLTRQSTWYTETQEDGSQWVYAALQVPQTWKSSSQPPEIVIDIECDNCGEHNASLTYDLKRTEFSVKSRQLYNAFETRVPSEEEPPVLTNSETSTNATTGNHWELTTTARNICSGPFDGAIRFAMNGTYGGEQLFWSLSHKSQLYAAEVGEKDQFRIVRWNPKYTLDFCENPDANLSLHVYCENCGINEPKVIRPTLPDVPDGSSLTEITFVGFWESGIACALQFTRPVSVPVVGYIPRMWFGPSSSNCDNPDSSNTSTLIPYQDWVMQRELLGEWQTDLNKKCKADTRWNWRGTRCQCNSIEGVLYHLVDWGEQKALTTGSAAYNGEDAPTKCEG